MTGKDQSGQSPFKLDTWEKPLDTQSPLNSCSDPEITGPEPNHRSNEWKAKSFGSGRLKKSSRRWQYSVRSCPAASRAACQAWS